MDDERFDTLTRWLGADHGSRRSLLRILAGGGLGVMLLARGGADAEACSRQHCGRRGGGPSRPRRCCAGYACSGGRCRPLGGCGRVGLSCRTAGDCCPGAACIFLAGAGRTCRCLTGQREVDGRCLPCQAPGEACSGGPGDCCGAAGACARVAADKDEPVECLNPASPTVCCFPLGVSGCQNSCQCCGDARCENGTCVRGCTAPKGVCGEGTRCCAPAAGCGLVRPTKPDGTVCPRDAELPDAPVCCVIDHQPCTESCQCCSDLVCRGGVCTVVLAPPPPPPCTDSSCFREEGAAVAIGVGVMEPEARRPRKRRKHRLRRR
jgi:hypothetical protein